MRTAAIIVAGGRGLRMKSDLRKQYLVFGGRSILSHTLAAFLTCPDVHRIFLVIPEADEAYCRDHILADFPDDCAIVDLVSGGVERQESVYNGLEAAMGLADIVAIHDGVRPFVQPDLITRCLAGAKAYGACVPGVPAVDTLKTVDNDITIEKTLDRRKVWCAQTPQAFRYDLIWAAHESARSAGVVETDDAALLERLGRPVRMIPGSRYNLKITTPEDLALASAVLALAASRKNRTKS
ncbi:2-C-methyl-D-erythritol 4-phosphate cytidylyltransferase [Desulfococcus multivorans]|jgi:2-C-methyl-D-erythritol 4-phosphate cytidylyltransferase|nr:2-C-methyl-D-erythritol 4-phosphate cytidylyltransferase [Desulfococcus multivorans]AQV01399.2 2-C-methyl-D-erythritol 4-phosphate cytidylyltransferase [Desulfococcus multivorans]MDX9819118.1 2-C-methyl-D-erythritol 4-phosphate cytidylyltransferase [Desulfococcus multivorans]